MNMKSTFRKAASLAMVLAAACAWPSDSAACSRVLYKGLDSLMVVGRSLDWKTPIPTNLYVYPRGMAKKGSDAPGAVEWTSKYGAVYAVGYDGGITEGMNEMGLVVNGLFCKGTVYNNADTDGRPPMSLAVFVGWLLDMNATTAECVEVLRKHDFTIGGATFDNGTAPTLHWGITDATGASAIVEFDHGKLNVYDMGDYRAMTNDPTWPAMTAIVDYWENIGGSHMMPGTVSSPSRCVRANYFAHHVERVDDPRLAVAITRSIVSEVSVPYSYMIEGEPNLSSTQWRSYAELRDRRYYFDIVTYDGIFYIDLTKLDLYPGAPVLKLDTSRDEGITGCANSHLRRSDPFTPMY